MNFLEARRGVLFTTCIRAPLHPAETMHKLTSSPWLKPWDSHPHEWGFLFHRSLPERALARPGLTASPQASNTVSPTACIFFAAFTSRSWTTPHSGHVQTRLARERDARICPQSKHRLGGGIQLVDLNKVASIPCCFILQLADKRTPSYITNGFRKRVILDYVVDAQALYADCLVLTNKACRELMLVVPSSISNPGV